MTRPRLAVIVAAHDGENPRRNFRRELDAELVEFHAPSGELPETYAYDGVVVTGSRASVYDDADWIASTRSWVDGALERSLPCLGVCWGHQLLADVLGGEVRAMDAYELGYADVERTSDDSRLLAGLEESFVAFATHSDEVAALPPGATLLAENERSIHAFRCGTAYGVQFHPEYDVRTAREVTHSKDGDATDDRIERALQSIDESAYRAACETKTLFENFLSIVDGAGGSATQVAARSDD